MFLCSRNRVIQVLALLSLIICSTNAEVPECGTKESCHECIQTPTCAWCQQPEFSGRPRCVARKDSNYCEDVFLIDPVTDHKAIQNMDLTMPSASGQPAPASNGHQNIVKIRPQRMALGMRINQAHRLDFQYAEVEDYPLDVYYLVGLSGAAETNSKLSLLADSLAETLPKLTSNFRLGFGSFGDKVPKKLEQPCEGCEPPYVYRNHMPLSSNITDFKTQVKNVAARSNLDAPSGGPDALIQAITCHNQLGWRGQARRVLIFATDTGFHFAGDGKLGGAIGSYDGECHLERNGTYGGSSQQNYPSVSQINEKIMESYVNIIFAATANQITTYRQLVNNIAGSSSSLLSSDPSNVVELLRDQYAKISSSVQIKDNATSHVQINYLSSCLTGQPPKPTSKCYGLKVGDVVKFTAEITITSCPADPRDWKQIIQIYTVGILGSLVIDLTMLCSCDCENPKYHTYQENSPQCSYSGAFMCGTCVCYDRRFGKRCECHTAANNDYACRPDNTTIVECSGRGNCVCGECVCDLRPNPEESLYGQFCECDNFSCGRSYGAICSGPDHGTCECGVCQCRPEWEGPACECLKSNEPCKAPNSDEICSGHGECQCGVCRCKTSEEGRYSGKYCEKCPTCMSRCHELRDCVQCQMYRTGLLKDEKDCTVNCVDFVPIATEKIEIDEERNEKLCVFYDEDDCKFTFKYSETGVGNKVKVYAQQERECPRVFNFFGGKF